MKSIDNARISSIYLSILLCFFAIVSAQNKQETPINANGSGRWTRTSNLNTVDQTRRKIDDEDVCVMPPESLEKTVTYKCPYKQCDTESENVPKSTVASVVCKPNYGSARNTSLTSTCLNKTWIPPIEDCIKKCPKLNPINVNLRCIRNGIEIPCNENSLIVGTKIRPTCKPFYTYKDTVPDYVEITCEEDGKWDRTLFSCVPECGLVYTNNTYVFEYPWHVAIYNSRKILICSGTIISPYLVLTAAHCLQENDVLANNTSKYEIVTSKVTRNYNTKDNENQKSFKIKEIRFSSKGYFGSADQYSSNIAVLILEEKLNLSATVLPACVDWISAKRKIYPSEGTPAQVAEWKTNGHGVVDEKLTTSEVHFVSRKRCLTMVPSDFKPLITFDKFCATIEDGTTGFSLTQENGGGGLLFSENSFYTIRGIVSLQQHSSSVAVFTDLADHLDWISAVHNETENRTSTVKKVTSESSGENICNLYGISNCTKIQDCSLTDILIVTKKAILCGYDVDDMERICCSTQYTSQVFPPVADTPQVPSPPTTTIPPNLTVITRNSSITAATYCAKYSKVVTSCSKDLEPRIGEVKSAGDREFPHVAVIGCGSELEDTYGCLMGSLISESFILSVPPKDPETITKWALLGDMVSWSFFRNTPYIIEKSFFHPEYTFPQNSIALYKLQTPMAMTSSMRPACLYLPNIYHPSINVTNRKFRITSWGNSKLFTGRTLNLFKTGAIVVDDQHCLNAYEKGLYDPNSMMCISNLTISKAFSLVNRGSPLKLASGSKSCTWSIFGLFLEMPKSSEDLTKSNLFAFTKVSYYLDWIEGIVWPSTTSPQIAQRMSPVPVKASQFEGAGINQLAPTKTPKEIASEYCDKYSRYGTQCIDDLPPRGTRKKALPKEYPHIAYIACESNVTGAYWTCVGSLISDRFVLSVAYCSTDGKGEAKLVRLGALSRSIIKNGSYDKVYEVERTYIHPDFSFPRRSIALYKLKTLVEFTAYVWPACLYSSTYDQLNSRLIMTSWGSHAIRDGESDDLLKGLLTVVDNKNCANIVGYDSDSMACAGDVTDGEAICLISLGSPLQMLQNNATCTRTIYAMHFGHTVLPSSCGNVTNAKPHLFTKVSYYLDWIQKIVWS